MPFNPKIKRNPALNSVIGSLVDVAGINPDSFNPDYVLGKDLGLSRLQIQRVLFDSAQSLQLPVSFEMCRVEDCTGRDLERILLRWIATTGIRKAG